MESDKKVLIWADVRSWLITSLLMALPAFLGEVLAYFQGFELSSLGTIGLLFLGMLLKLLQKWNQENYYPVKM